MREVVVWALFDSGNGCYTKAITRLNGEDGLCLKVYPIGIDVEKKHNHFINLDLADYKRLFGDNTLFDTLDKLPRPDVIVASPPCESWSVASAMKDGNACWKQEDLSDNLFSPQKEPSRFTVREFAEYEGYQYYYDRQFLKRINGELCVFNTVEIIKRYQPKIYLIENPAYGRIWEYIEKVMGFPLPFKNVVRYSNYDYMLQKPTIFGGNIFLNLNALSDVRNTVSFNSICSYNDRSNIPEKLLLTIFRKIVKELNKKEMV